MVFKTLSETVGCTHYLIYNSTVVHISNYQVTHARWFLKFGSSRKDQSCTQPKRVVKVIFLKGPPQRTIKGSTAQPVYTSICCTLWAKGLDLLDLFGGHSTTAEYIVDMVGISHHRRLCFNHSSCLGFESLLLFVPNQGYRLLNTYGPERETERERHMGFLQVTCFPTSSCWLWIHFPGAEYPDGACERWSFGSVPWGHNNKGKTTTKPF